MSQDKTDVDEEEDDLEDPVESAGALVADLDPEMLEETLDEMDAEDVLEILPKLRPARCLRRAIRNKVIEKLKEIIT